MNTMLISPATTFQANGPAAETPKQAIAIHSHAPVLCSKSILITASPAQVWAVLTDIAQWPTWNKEVAKAKFEGPLMVGAQFDWKTGGIMIHSTLHTVSAPAQFGWTGKAFGANAIHNWTLQEVAGKTEVTVEESMEGWLVQLLRKMFQKNLEQGMVLWLEALRQRCER